MRIVLILFLSLSATFSAQQKVYKTLFKGDKKIEKSDTIAALDLYFKALFMDSTVADTYAKISDIYVAQGNYLDAIDLLDKGIRITMAVPKKSESISHLFSVRSFLYFNMNKFGSALTDLDQAILLNESNPNYYYMRALIRRMNGDERGCCSDLDRAISLGMENAKVYRQTYCN